MNEHSFVRDVEVVVNIQDIIPVLVTAMPKTYHHLRLFWLQRHNINVGSIVFREPDDHSASTVYKRRVAEQLQAAGNEIVMAYDDRLDVLDVYNDLNIPNKRVFIHEQELHH